MKLIKAIVLVAGYDPDAPGHFVPFLIEKKTVHAYMFEGKRYDIGTIESYEKVQKLFSQKNS